MELGKPFSQLCGVLHGLSDMLSDSVLAHPLHATAANASSKRNTQRE